MNIKHFLMALAAGTILFAGCKKAPVGEPATPSSKDRTIKFTTSLYQFTKATDTAFEENDAIGVNIFTPECYLYNAKYTFSNGALAAATPNEWYEDEDLEATITAVYPFNHALNSYLGAETFTVNADQSTKDGYAMSDLLFAVTKSKPTEDAVKLPFKHALSKIVVTLDNQLGEEIAQLWFTDVLGTVSYDPKDPFSMTTSGSAGTIKAYKSGQDTWQLIIVPQTAAPKLALTTASGKQFTFILDGEETFTSGKLSTATITVSKESIYTSFTPEIEDWTSDNELNFSQTEEEEPVVPDPVVPETPKEVRIYLKNDWGWTNIWCWDGQGNQIFEETDWPGTKYHGEEDGYYYWTIPESYVGKTVSLLAIKLKADNPSEAEEQSADFTNVTLTSSVYFHLIYTEGFGVTLVKEEK